MVTNVTNFSRSGLYDWMAQRVSAVVLAAYFLFLIGYLIANPGLEFAQWRELFLVELDAHFQSSRAGCSERSCMGWYVDYFHRLPDQHGNR